MARTIKKAIIESIITVAYIDENDEYKEGQIPVKGRPTENRALIIAQKKYGKNAMVLDIETDETSISISPVAFLAHSEVCEEGETYGREFVTQTFEITSFNVKYRTKAGMMETTLFYDGKTTVSKLRNFAIEKLDTKNVLVLPNTIEVTQERRYMTKSAYLQLAMQYN